jgi:hypothetical protein
MLRSRSRYVIQTDISRFYQSIYTHSIPWALHGKAAAKANRSRRLIGNTLDKLVREGQDRQTIGVPIGPDTSLIIAEIILSSVDEALKRKRLKNGLRYIDDYDFGFQTQIFYITSTKPSLSHIKIQKKPYYHMPYRA